MLRAINLDRFHEVTQTFHDGLNARLKILSKLWNPTDDESKAKAIKWARVFVLRDSIRHLERVFDMNQRFTIPPTQNHDRAFVESIFPALVFAALDYANAQRAMFQIIAETKGCDAKIPLGHDGSFAPLICLDDFDDAIESNVAKLNETITAIESEFKSHDEEIKWTKDFVFGNLDSLHEIVDENESVRIPSTKYDPDLIRALVTRFVPVAQKYASIEFTVQTLATEMGVKVGRCCTCFRAANETDVYKGCTKCGKRVWCSDQCRGSDTTHMCDYE